MIHLGWFLLIVVILIIAFIAEHLDEDLENEQPNSLEEPDSLEEPNSLEEYNSLEKLNSLEKSKSKNLFEWSENDSEPYSVEEYSTKKEDINNQDSITYEALSNNIIAHYKNSFVKLYPDS